MKRVSSTVAALFVALLASAPARADAPAPSDGLIGTPEELQGWSAVEESKWVRARELGEKILKEHPDSFAGHYIVGMAMHYGEGDLARSAFHLDLAVKRFEERFGPTPDLGRPWRWHESALKQLAFTYGEMDRPADELALFIRFDKVYQPKKLAERVWPLMKLRRYDEARAAAKIAVATGDHEQKMIARSDLCAAECEAGSRARAYEACTDALVEFKHSLVGGMVEFSNASEAALTVLKYDEAERFLGESTKRAVPDSWGNPFQHLGMLLITEGRIPEAIAALKGGQELRMQRPAWLDQHGQARLDQTLAELLLVVGETDRAVQIARRAVERPDRMGVNSGTDRQAVAATALGMAVALSEQAERHLEEATTSGFLDGMKLRMKAIEERIEAWRSRRRAAVLLADENFLERSLRPYYVGGADLPPWMMSEVVGAVGGGVALAAIAHARAVEVLPGAAAFFDALLAEAEFLRGETGQALAAAERALEKLPQAEQLLRGRVAAIAGESARLEGDPAAADALFAKALVHDPGVFRRLGIKLPVTVESDGSELATRAARLIDRSPRFRTGKGGFRVVLRDGEACLMGIGGERIQCAAPTAGGDPARKLVAALHKVAFALKSDLSQEDLTTLDGSPTAQRADHQVKSLLDSMAP